MDINQQKLVLTNFINVLNTSQARGTWRTNELKTIGTLFEELAGHLQSVQNIINENQPPSANVDASNADVSNEVSQPEQSSEEVKTI